MTGAKLPPGVIRDEYARSDVNLENCELVQFCMRDKRGSITSINVSRHGLRLVHPEKRHSRIRDVRPGDYVVFLGDRRLIVEVVVYR